MTTPSSSPLPPSSTLAITSFAALGLIDPLQRAVADAGYVTPTPIQVQAIPHLLAGRDVLGCAQTGTGKTAAFALPILQRLARHPRRPGRGPRALVLTPTRELATQIADDFANYGVHVIQQVRRRVRRRRPGAPGAGAARQRRHRGGHAGPPPRSHGAGPRALRSVRGAGARRSRSDAGHGLHRPDSPHPGCTAAQAAEPHVLGDDAARDRAAGPQVPGRPGQRRRHAGLEHRRADHAVGAPRRARRQARVAARSAERSEDEARAGVHAHQARRQQGRRGTRPQRRARRRDSRQQVAGRAPACPGLVQARRHPRAGRD